MDYPSETKSIDVVCFSDIFWDSLWQRHQHLLTGFPSNWRILFIEPTSIPVLLRQPHRLFTRNEKNISIVSLPSFPLIDKFKSLRWINDSFILLWLRLIFRKQNIKEPLLFYYEPRYSSLIGKLKETMVVFDYIDDKLSFSNVPSWMKIYLDRLIEKANIIFVASSYLHQNITKHREHNVHFIGNGVDIDHFKEAMTDIPIPDDVKNIKKPIVGYIGALSDWVDFDIIESIAREYPDYSVVLVGPEFPNVKNKIDSLKEFPNIFVFGKKPYEELPNYLKFFDTCIIPFKINDLTISSNPVKFYEYIAAGKSVISTDLPEIRNCNDLAYIAKNLDIFVTMVPLALNFHQNINLAFNFLEKKTWKNKKNSMVEIIMQKLDELDKSNNS
ncbi:MAG: glycosyltransferase [Methanococcoides sp.]|nr:glycosyltransferase [Methanococcoides sp.]